MVQIWCNEARPPWESPPVDGKLLSGVNSWLVSPGTSRPAKRITLSIVFCITKSPSSIMPLVNVRAILDDERLHWALFLVFAGFVIYPGVVGLFVRTLSTILYLTFV